MKKIIIGSLLLASQNLFAENQNLQTSPDQMPSDNNSVAVKQIGKIPRWIFPPRVKLTDSELQGKNRTITVKIQADTLGLITAVSIEKSSGLPNLDEKVLYAVKKAKFRPYKENGIALPFIVSQPFNFALSSNQVTKPHQIEPELCTLNFNSKNWRAQNSKQATPFQYQAQPQALTIKTALLGNSDKVVDFAFQLSQKNKLSNITLIKSSGVVQIDEQVLAAVKNAQITSPRKFWQWGNLKFQDQIVFWKSYCR